MVSIDVGRINAMSPYVVTETEKGVTYKFMTDSGVSFSVSFLPDELLSCCPSYQFIIANTNHKPSPRDPKLSQTVMAIIYEFFNRSDVAMLYFCETGDGKQGMRQRLFDYWFSSSPRNSSFTCISGMVCDEEGVMNYVALVSRLDNPCLQQAIFEFTQTLQLLRQKPE